MIPDVRVPKVWDLLKHFRETCRRRGWKTSDYEYIVKVDDEYHNFIGARATHTSTFKRIASSKKCAVANGRSYRVIDVSYTAWVFQQQPSEQLIEALAMNSELSKKTAMYDLSNLYRGKPVCLKVNETDSPVFDEFEKYLKEMYGVETKSLYEPRKRQPRSFKSKLQKASIG